jgi:hypothetical protein
MTVGLEFLDDTGKPRTVVVVPVVALVLDSNDMIIIAVIRAPHKDLTPGFERRECP